MTSDETIRTVLIIIGLILALPFLMMIFAIPLMGGHMWNGGMWDTTGPLSAWLIVWGGLLLVILVGGYLLMRTTSQDDAAETDPALEELRMAYARGELSDEEFEKRMERLNRD